ncbi:hypothetical protein EIN_429820 [Entamoeba invadens IP1]|uniref:Uncharacterized protein n=1 Tax=Entamoeba invadens IP1 TaxID=370355 RepID=A0A0A1UF19_ENTIV|nr:hypothetical protein EIN_429820 [Entamoeba invadens IP1]ELP95206.1 hypothetical protein EIN_429820 [Entamoeba invadens IP1]|eukprot:XP_004261977.1 hypothetical protein EIN_429820 [Entamoeba invadens IP1]
MPKKKYPNEKIRKLQNEFFGAQRSQKIVKCYSRPQKRFSQQLEIQMGFGDGKIAETTSEQAETSVVISEEVEKRLDELTETTQTLENSGDLKFKKKRLNFFKLFQFMKKDEVTAQVIETELKEIQVETNLVHKEPINIIKDIPIDMKNVVDTKVEVLPPKEVELKKSEVNPLVHISDTKIPLWIDENDKTKVRIMRAGFLIGVGAMIMICVIFFIVLGILI